MTVMALVAVSVWDALSLDSRDAQILGPLPVRARRHPAREGVGAHPVCGGVCRGIESAPALIHPVLAVSRLQPSILQIATLIAAQLTSTTAAATFGFFAVLGTA